jgi:putative hydrolase of the HAD superfamily
MLEGIKTIIFDLGGTVKIDGVWEWHSDYLEIKRLAKDYRVVIAANQPHKARKFIEKSKIAENISKIYLSQEMHLSKPNTKFFQYVLEDLKLKAADVVYVGNDLIYDVLVPQKLGIRTIFVKRPFKAIFIKNFIANILFIHPDHVVRSIRDIK